MAFEHFQYLASPLEIQAKQQALQANSYKNLLAEQAFKDEQEKRAGYEAAYKNWLTPQQQQQAEIIEPTSAVRKLYGEEAQPVQVQAAPQASQPFTAPQGANYAYIQGVDEANAVFQKQQNEYYSQNVAPLLKHFIETGDDANYRKLIDQLAVTENPVAGMARNFAGMLAGTSVPTPGEIGSVKMSPQLRKIATEVAANPTIKAALEAIEDGDQVNLKWKGDTITEVSVPKSTMWGEERMELEREKLRLQQGKLDKQRQELKEKYDPEVQGAVAESKKASEEMGKATFEVIKSIPKLKHRVETFARLEELVINNPGAFGKFAKAKAELAALTNPAAIEASSKDIKARRQLEIQIRNLMDDQLKKMFGPPFSDSDLKIMFQMTGADLNSPTGLLEAIRLARGSLASELQEAEYIRQTARPTTIPRANKQQPEATKQPERSRMIPTRAKLVGKDNRTGNEVYAVTEKGKTFYFDGVTGKELK